MHTCEVKYTDEMVLEPKEFEYCGEPAPYKWGAMWLCVAHWEVFKDYDDTWEGGLMSSVFVPKYLRGAM